MGVLGGWAGEAVGSAEALGGGAGRGSLLWRLVPGEAAALCAWDTPSVNTERLNNLGHPPSPRKTGTAVPQDLGDSSGAGRA